jgi:hypothetical protein
MSREPQFWGKLTIEAKGATTDQKNPEFVVLADVSVE